MREVSGANYTGTASILSHASGNRGETVATGCLATDDAIPAYEPGSMIRVGEATCEDALTTQATTCLK